jgi:hypothetical protein
MLPNFNVRPSNVVVLAPCSRQQLHCFTSFLLVQDPGLFWISVVLDRSSSRLEYGSTPASLIEFCYQAILGTVPHIVQNTVIIVQSAKVRTNGPNHEYRVNIRKCEPVYTTMRGLCSLVDTPHASRHHSGRLKAVSDWSGNCNRVIAMGSKGVR